MQRHISLATTEITPVKMPHWDDALFASIEVVCPRNTTWSAFELAPLAVFSESVIHFVTELSRRLLQLANSQPDLAALGFFLRPAALHQALQQYKHTDLMPLGLTFHLVPSNVPTVAFYSWLAALLQGNSAIVRLSSRSNQVQEAMLNLLNQMFSEVEWHAIAARVRFVRYPHNDAITEYFSAVCYSRVIWGGDSTIHEIRKIPLSAKAKELCFPERKSVAVLDSHYLNELSESEFTQLIQRLGLDISQFNQQACASPVLLVWRGEPSIALWQRFWLALSCQFPDEFADKLEQTVNLQLAACDGLISRVVQFGNLTIAEISHAADVTCCGFGDGLLVYQIVDELDDWLTQPASFQTCVYVGANKTHFVELVKKSLTMRIDRICSAGQALAFDWVWDGHDMLREFSRVLG
nr:acyl-CoA reductase [uncultured Tolumonas sp.]